MNYQTLKNILKNEYITVNGSFNGKKKISRELLDSIFEVTSFLDYDAPISVRVSYIIHDVHEQKKCLECGKSIQHKLSVTKASDFCSLKCSQRSERTKSKRAQTNIEKWGIENPFQDTKKIQDSVLEKHGVTNVSKLEDVKTKISQKNKSNCDDRINKIKKTVKEKYGEDWISKTDYWKEKITETNKQKYGTEWSFQSPEIKEKIAKTNLTKYQVSNPSKTVGVVNKIAQTKENRYGNSKYNNSEKAKRTMIEKYGCHSQQTHWSPETLRTVQDVEQLKEFVKDKTINQAAEQLGIAPTTLRYYLQSNDVEFYLKRKNQYENFVKEILDECNIQYVTNDRSIISPHELDFVIPSLNLAIECNGIFWHSELMGKTRNYHLEKTLLCEQANYRLVHLWDYQIDQKPQIVRSMIKHMVGKSDNRIYARNTKIVEIDKKDYREFLLLNHLQGPVNSPMRLGLEHDGILVAVIGAGRSRFKQDEYELHRLAFLNDTAVIGGATKLFKHLTENYNIDNIISYADRDYSKGEIYSLLGFKLVDISKPNYYYFKNRKVESRIKYQKHKLPKLLEVFDPNLTEWENMKLNNFNRFWTTGNIKYEFKKN